MQKTVTLRDFEEGGALAELCGRARVVEDAASLLVGLALGDDPVDLKALPPFHESEGLGGARVYWYEVARVLEGRADLARLAAEAARMLPGCAAFAGYGQEEAPRGSAPAAPEERAARALVVEWSGRSLDGTDPRDVARWLEPVWEAAGAERGRLRVDLVTRGSVCAHVSFAGATRGELTALVGRMGGAVGNDVRVRCEEHTFRDFYLDPVFAEGPDSQRFELDHVRASTRVGDVALGIMGEYADAFWPTDKAGKQAPSTVDLRGRSSRWGQGPHTPGEVRRLQADQTLADAGVYPWDTLSVFPERRAGSVNPFLRAESLTVVRNQILDFARSHADFEVAANATDIPTEYVFRFRAPGYAPGDPPRRLDRHEVLLVMPAEFPVKAPQAYWQHSMFHPNVHAESGLVCLGVLAESYKPGLHFGTVCQMLVDIASYRNYALDEGYDVEAARWAASDEGQRAIRAIGGRSREEVLGAPEALAGGFGRPARRVRLRRVEA